MKRHFILGILSCIAVLMVSLITHPSSFASNVRVTARANVEQSFGVSNDKAYRHPIKVLIDFTGSAAANATRYGKIQVNSATSNLGTLEMLGRVESSFQFIDSFNPMERISNGLRLKFRFANDNNPTKIQQLQGTIDFQTTDLNKVVTVNNLSGNFPLPVNHSLLQNLGKFAIKYTEGMLTVVGEGNNLPDFNARFIEGNGNITALDGVGDISIDGNVSRIVGSWVPEESLSNGSVEIILGFNTTTVPFNLSNIPIQK